MQTNQPTENNKKIHEGDTTSGSVVKASADKLCFLAKLAKYPSYVKRYLIADADQGIFSTSYDYPSTGAL